MPAVVVVRFTSNVNTYLPASSDSLDSSTVFAASSGVGATYVSPTLIFATPRSPAWLASA